MTFKLIVKPHAELDTIEAVMWYNAIREGLGDEFLLTLDAKLTKSFAILFNTQFFISQYTVDLRNVFLMVYILL